MLLGGWLDTSDHMDAYLLGSPWTGFFNYVFSTGGASIPIPNEGLGLNWGVPMESTYGPGLLERTTAEVFYRIQLFEDLAVTPNLQYLKNPAYG